MSEIDEALEPTSTIYVYQAQILYTDNEIVLVKAYNQDHAAQIIQENYKDKSNLRITSLQPTTNDTTRNILNNTKN